MRKDVLLMNSNKARIALFIVLFVIIWVISGMWGTMLLMQERETASVLSRTAGGILEGLLVFLVGRNLNREKAGKVVKIIGCVMMITSVIGGTVMLIAGGKI